MASLTKSLALMFDLSMIRWHQFVTVWSVRLTTLEIGYLPSVMAIRVFSSGRYGEHSQNLKKLCLSVDCITDAMMTVISQTLKWLTHLDVRDAPPAEPRVVTDLTDSGFQQINPGGRLSHLSIVRSQEFIFTYFKRVTDLGILLMADRCAAMKSICLGGFCRITDTGIRALLHSCSDLRRLKISHGPQLTDLVFHDISATSLSLSHVSLRWCSLLTDSAVLSLSFNTGLAVVDLRACRSIGDESLRSIVNLRGLTTLMLDGSDITDGGLLHLRETVVPNLTSLSLRGCRRLTGSCMSSLFLSSTVRHHLKELDVSYLPDLSDDGIMLLAKCRVPLAELRMRQCPLIGDAAVMALASMQVDTWSVHGGSLRLLDLFSCGNITPLSFRWLKKPYFPKLRWLGLSGGSQNRALVEALRRNRPFLRVERSGDELGATHWDSCFNVLDYEELDELEQWLLAGDDEDYM